MIKAIETRYKGYRFRSRLEARWAVFFDSLGIEWKYEDEGYDLDGVRYLPDFWLPSVNCFAEVKGADPLPEEMQKINALRTALSDDFKLYDRDERSVVILRDIPEPGKPQHVRFHGTRFGLKEISDPETTGTILRACFDASYCASGGECGFFCPVCGSEWVHFKAPTHEVVDDYSAWTGRGPAIKIPMWCESGCAWTLLFGFHKGNTYAAIKERTQITGDFFVAVSRGNTFALREAFAAARAARFEHGECPA